MKNANDYSKIAELYDAYVRETFDISFFLFLISMVIIHVQNSMKI